jgi:hypothetical protein
MRLSFATNTLRTQRIPLTSYNTAGYVTTLVCVCYYAHLCMLYTCTLYAVPTPLLLLFELPFRA